MKVLRAAGINAQLLLLFSCRVALADVGALDGSIPCDPGFVGSRYVNSPLFATCCLMSYYTLEPCPTRGPYDTYDVELCGCPLFMPICTSSGCTTAPPSCAGKPSTSSISSLTNPSEKLLAVEHVASIDAPEREVGGPDSSVGATTTAGSEARGSTGSDAAYASAVSQSASTAAVATCNVTTATGVTQQSCATPPIGCAFLSCIPAGQGLQDGCGYVPAADALNYSSMSIAGLTYPPTTSKSTFPCLYALFPFGPSATYSMALACKYNTSGAALVTTMQLKLQSVCNSGAVTGDSNTPLYWQATGLDSDTPKARWSTQDIVGVADGTSSTGLISTLAAAQQAESSQADRPAPTFDAAMWATFRNASSYGRNSTNTTGNNTKVATSGAGQRRHLLQQCLPPPAFARDMFDQDVCNQLNAQCPKGAKFAKVCIPVGKAANGVKWFNKLVQLLKRGSGLVLPPPAQGVVKVCSYGMKAYKVSCLNKKTAADCSALDSDVNTVCDANKCNCGYYNYFTPCYSICVLHRCACPASLCPVPVVA